MLKRKQNTKVFLARNVENQADIVMETAQIIQKVKPQNHYGLCPICIEELIFVNRLHICTKCHKQYVRRSRDGELIDCVLLPYGYCRCCDQAFPLIKIINTEDLLCPISKERYFFYLNKHLRVSELPFGICSCCQIASPLINKTDGSIYCNISKENYIRNNNGTIMRKPVEVNLPSSTEIEAALNEGTAAFYYGGFIGTQEPEPPNEIPKRRRR
jgi:hypothetical protein